MYGFSGLLPENYPESSIIHGVSDDVEDVAWLDECGARGFFMPRGLVEDNPDYKQVIPYIIVRDDTHVFAYQRDGAESRLTKKVSIGIGGHVNLKDHMFPNPISNSVYKAAFREFNEELAIPNLTHSAEMLISYHLSRPTFVLYAGKAEDIVNSVHIGSVFIIKLSKEQLKSATLKEEGKQLSLMTVDELKNCDDLEEWSRLVVEKCL